MIICFKWQLLKEGRCQAESIGIGRSWDEKRDGAQLPARPEPLGIYSLEVEWGGALGVNG